MTSCPQLSCGALSRMLRSNESVDGPIVQILGSKLMQNKNIRCVISDGIDRSQHCIVVNRSNQLEERYNRSEFCKFCIIRLDKYSVSVLDTKDIPVILVYEFTLLMNGSQIGRPLGAGDSAMQTNRPSLQTNTSDNRDVSLEPQSNQLFTNNSNANSCVQSKSHSNDAVIRSNTTTPTINPENVCPINAITPFFNAFIIRARVTTKSPIRTYNNKKGDGKVFSFDVTDDSSEIRITAFNNECDKFYDIIEKDLVYYISKGNVKAANKKYSNLKSDYEITLNSDSLIELCTEDIPLNSFKLKFKFVGIKDLATVSNSSSVDVIGVIRSVSDLESIISKKNSKEYKKREVLLLDKTCAEVRLTVWGKEAEDFNASIGSILAVKNAVVGEFKGKTLGCVQNTILEFDPDLTEAHILKGWYDREKDNLSVVAMSKQSDSNVNNNFKYLSQVNVQSIPESSLLYYNCRATILATNRPQNHFYKSCGLNGCMKKVIDENGYYHCDKCGNRSPSFQWRLMLSLCVADSTGETWLTAFQEVAEKLIGLSTNELSQIYESDPNQYSAIISSLNFKTFNFRVGSKVDEYNNEKRIKSTCFTITPIDPRKRSKELIQNLRNFSQ